MANLTLSVDEEKTAQARAKAQAMGMTLNQFLRQQIDRLAGADQREQEANAYLASAGKGHSGGWVYRREELQRGS